MELVPEWYKASKGAKNNTTSNSNSDGNSAGVSLTDRHSLISRNRQSSTSNLSLSSTRWNLGSDGSVRGSKNSSRAYSNFGRRDRRKNLDPHEDDIGAHNYRNSSVGSSINSSINSGRTDKDSSWRSHSGVFRDSESDSTRVVPSAENASSGIRRAVSYKRDFPLLITDEIGATLGSKRVSSAVLTRTPSGTSLASGGSTWKSALAEVPAGVVCNEVTYSSDVKSTPVSPVFSATNNSSGLNMAEALLQAPSRGRNAPKLSTDTSLADELTLRQCKQLIPKTPSMPKSVCLNSLEKLRFRGTARSGDFGGPSKSSQQFSSQLLVVNNSLKVPKAQLGNFQALSRENASIISPASEDVSSKDVSVTPNNSNLKPEHKGDKTSTWSSLKMTLSSSRDRKALSLTKDRIDFFNSIRNKSSINKASNAVPEPSYLNGSEKSLSLGEQLEKDLLDGNCGDASAVNQKVNEEDVACNDASVHNQGEKCWDETSGDASDNDDNCKDGMFLDISANNLDKRSGNSGVKFGDGDDACRDKMHSHSPENVGESRHLSCSLDGNYHSVDLDEREKAFLRSLGWDENAREEGLTNEEISAFITEYEKLKPCSKFSDRFEAVRLSVTQTS